MACYHHFLLLSGCIILKKCPARSWEKKGKLNSILMVVISPHSPRLEARHMKTTQQPLVKVHLRYWQGYPAPVINVQSDVDNLHFIHTAICSAGSCFLLVFSLCAQMTSLFSNNNSVKVLPGLNVWSRLWAMALFYSPNHNIWAGKNKKYLFLLIEIQVIFIDK